MLCLRSIYNSFFIAFYVISDTIHLGYLRPSRYITNFSHFKINTRMSILRIRIVLRVKQYGCFTASSDIFKSPEKEGFRGSIIVRFIYYELCFVGNVDWIFYIESQGCHTSDLLRTPQNSRMRVATLNLIHECFNSGIRSFCCYTTMERIRMHCHICEFNGRGS